MIVPTSDDNGNEYESEYLGLYKRVENLPLTQSTVGRTDFGTAVMPPLGSGIWIKQL